MEQISNDDKSITRNIQTSKMFLKFHLSPPIVLFTLIVTSLCVYWLLGLVNIRQWKQTETTTPLVQLKARVENVSNFHNNSITKKPKYGFTREEFKFPLYPPATILINRTDFLYITNRDVCGRDQVYMLVIVGSHPQNNVMRSTIRQTLGNTTIDGFHLKLIFVFGKVQDHKRQQDLMKESAIYKDIVQGNFHDSYQNMSLRDIMGLRWAWQFCKQAKYVMHLDDDVSVDVFRLSQILNTKFNKGRDFVGCFMLMQGMPVLRSGRYGVSVQEYPANTYDPYCSGWMYVMNTRMAYLIDITAMRVKPLWINDAFITGTVLAALGMKLQDLDIPSTMDNQQMITMDQQSDQLPLKYAVGYVALNETLVRNLHRKYERQYKRWNHDV